MVITGLTRNQVVLTGSWVRIPPLPPLKKESSIGRLFFYHIADSGEIRRRPCQDVSASAHRRYKQSGGLFVGRAQIELFNNYNAIMRDVLQKQYKHTPLPPYGSEVVDGTTSFYFSGKRRDSKATVPRHKSY